MTQRGQSDELAERLRTYIDDVPDFPRPGIVFRDITRLLSDAWAFRAASSAIAERWRDADVAAVAGIESRGFVIGGAVARELNVGFVAVRKAGKLPRATLSESYSLEYGEAILEVHADALGAGDRVLVVDDLLATGGTASAASKLLERLGATVVGLAFIVELVELDGADALQGREFSTLLRL